MTRVLLLSHEGVRCALPASQVMSAGSDADAPEIRLFSAAGEDDRSVRRSILVSTPSGPRRVGCAEARVASLGARLHVLPELLRQCLHLPHVVGVAEGDDGLRWLVDLEAWEDR